MWETSYFSHSSLVLETFLVTRLLSKTTGKGIISSLVDLLPLRRAFVKVEIISTNSRAG